MKASYKQWLTSLPQPSGLLEAIQRKSRKALLDMEIKLIEDDSWRLTNRKQLENLLKLPLDNSKAKQEINTNKGLARLPSKGFRLDLNGKSNCFDQDKLPTGFSVLNSKEIKTFIENQSKNNINPEHWSIAINNASSNHIIGLRIKGNDIPALELVMQAKEKEFIPTRILIIIEDKSDLELLEVLVGANKSGQSHMIDIYLGKESKLQHGLICSGRSESNFLANVIVNQEAFSTYNFTSVQYGYELGRLETHINQKDGNAKTNLNGLQVSTGNEQLATYSKIHFNGPEGHFDQLQKSTASKKSHCIFHGSINVPKIAQQTNASQLSKNLLLSKRAKIDTKPELKIIADDVKCTHGATISQLQEDEIFYLRSRGISAKQATSLLIEGYCKEILESLPVEASRWGILTQILTSIQE